MSSSEKPLFSSTMISRFLDSFISTQDDLPGSFSMRLHFVILSGLILFSTISAFYFNELVLLGLPLVALVGFVALADFRLLYFLLWTSVIISTEFYLPGGFGTDLPSEPLALLLIGVGGLWFLSRVRNIDFSNLMHPLTLVVLLHFGWICVTALTAGNSFVSIKYAMAKSWYLGAYFFLPFAIFRNFKTIKTWIWFIAIPLLLTVIWVMVRHSQLGFSFSTISTIVSPFYRNHVNYACTIVVFLPYIAWLYSTLSSKRKKQGLIASMLFLLIALYFSYTRAAYLCIPIMIAYYFVVKLKLTKLLIAGGIIVLKQGNQ